MARYYGLKNDPTKFHSCTLSMQTNDPIVPHDMLKRVNHFCHTQNGDHPTS